METDKIIDEITTAVKQMASDGRGTSKFFVFDTQKGRQISQLKEAIGDGIEVKCRGYRMPWKVSIKEEN